MYDDKAEEVVLLLTPDKDLPPIPSDASSSPSPNVGSFSPSSSNVAIKTSVLDSALDKLDNLVNNSLNIYFVYFDRILDDSVFSPITKTVSRL
jgi:hypothetical protein